MTPREACEALLPDLVEAACGELPAERKAAFDQHLAGCNACRDELAQMQSVATVLRETSDTPDPLELAGFARRTALAAERRRDSSLRGLWWSLSRAQRFASVLSAGALAAALMLFIGARTEPVARVTVVAAGPAEAEETASEGENIYLWDLSEDVDVSQFAGMDSPVSLDDAFESLTEEELDTLATMLASSTG